MQVTIAGTPSEIVEALERLRNDKGGGESTYRGSRGSTASGQIVCTPKSLPRHLWVLAAERAVEENAGNRPAVDRLAAAAPALNLTREFLAVVTKKFWGARGVRLSVGFLDGPPAALRNRILSHMNAWSRTANVEFAESNTDPQVRIARARGDGYWSYVGTDILSIDADQPTMNLDSFSMATPDAEFHRVVRHETGHTLGCPHEHMRRELVESIDPDRAIEYFRRTQGWSEEETRQQVLTPIEEGSLLGTLHADPNSIMCYQIPGEITKDGQPIIGGLDIDESDYGFIATVYPKPGAEGSGSGGGRRKHRKGDRGRAPGATLANCTVKFHTNNEDKDGDTHVTVTLKDDNNVVAARVSNDFGHFDDNSDAGPFALAVQNASAKESLQRGNVTVRIDPNGHDTWRFNFFLDLHFSDGSHLSGGADGLELTQDRKEQNFGLDGILRG